MQTLQMLAVDGGSIFAGVTGIAILLIVILSFVFWLWMLIDCLSSSLPQTEKLIWFLVILFMHVVGAILYFFVGRSGRTRIV